MNLILKRVDFRNHGIYGSLVGDGLELVTLEHAYEQAGYYLPKLMRGTYLCMRGVHRLSDQYNPIETFMVTKVPNHTGILIHPGNYNADSDGCILIGIEKDLDRRMILDSRRAFDKFMDAQKDCSEFQLTVE